MERLVSWIVQDTMELVLKWKLNPETAVRLAIVRAISTIAGEPFPEPISGFRSPARQRCLKENWDAGRQVNKACSMPAFAPARASFHTIGQAFDLKQPLGAVGRSVWTQLGHSVDGASFGDPNHYHTLKPFSKAPKLW